MSRDHDLLAPAWAGTVAPELVDDRALVAAMIRVEVALATAQARLGVIPAGTGAAIADAAPETLDAEALTAGLRATANPVVGFVDLLGAAVAEKDPEAAEYVHRGGTSQDVLDTALALLCRDALDEIDARLGTCVEGLAGLARRHRDTPMAGRTLTQHAVPVTFGLKAATWLQGVLGARERVREVRGRLPVSLGGAAGTLAAYLEHARVAGSADPAGTTLALPDLVADELGLARHPVPWHGIRTPFAEVGAVLAETVGVLGKIAADTLVLSRTEIAEVTEDPAAGRGASSAMPQKANPVLATLVATAARQIPAQVSVLFSAMAVEDERSSGGWHAEWQALRESLRLGVGAAVNAAELTGSLTVDPERMADTVERTGGAIVSERLSARLAALAGRKEAKSLLAAATAEAGRSGRDLLDVVAEELRGRGLSAPDLAGTLDPTAYLGLSGPLVDRVLATADAGPAAGA